MGHGGDGYFKVLDTTVIYAQNMADYFDDPAFKHKYNNIFFMSDSCGAGTLFHKIGELDGAYFMGSSNWDQNSLSLDYDEIFSQPLNDRFSHRFAELMQENLKLPISVNEDEKVKWSMVQDNMNFTY